MSLVYVYMGGCAAVGGAVFVASKVLSYVNGPPAVPIPPAPSPDSNELSRRRDESETEHAKRLQKHLNQLHVSLASLSSQYLEKYGVLPGDRSAVEETRVKSLSLKQLGSKSSKKSCPTSESSSEGARKAATVIQMNKKSCAQTFSLSSSTKYTDAENSSHGVGFSVEEKSAQKDPLVGGTEVEPKEKVEKWLETSTASHLTHKNSAQHGKPNFPKPIAMTVPVFDPPKMWNTVDRDPIEACESYTRSSPRPESPKKNAPHLYKRLNLRKKSAVNLKDSKSSKSKSRKLEEDNDHIPSTHRDKSPTPDVHRKNFSSETELTKKKRAVGKENADSQDCDDSDIDPSTESTNHRFEGSDSEHFVDSNVESSDECAANTKYNARSAGTYAAGSYRNRSVEPSKTGFAQSTGHLTSAETAFKPSGPKMMLSQTELKKKIDEVLGLTPKSLEKRKSTPTASKRSESSLGEAKRKSSKNQFDSDSDDEIVWTTKPKSSALKREGNSKAPALRKTSSSRKRLDADDPDSCEQEDDGGKSKVSDGKKAFAADNKMKFSSSSQERPSKSGSGILKRLTSSFDKSKDIEDATRDKRSGSTERSKAAENASLFSARRMNEKSREFLAKYRLRDVTGKERPKSAEKVESPPKVNSFDKRKEFQAKYHMKERLESDGPKLEERDTKSNQFVKRKEFEAKFHMKDGRDASEEVDSPKKENPFDKRKEFQAKYHMKERFESDGPKPVDSDTKPTQFDKRKGFEAKFHSEEVGLPSKANSFDKRKELQAKYLTRSSSPDQPFKSADAVVLNTQFRTDRRKEALSLYQKKYLPGRAEVSSAGKEETSLKSPGNKIKEPGKRSTSTGRTLPGRDEAGGKPEKASPLQRRMEYDAKCRMKSLGLSRRRSATNDSGELEAEREYKGQRRVKGTDSSMGRPSTAEKSSTPSAKDRSSLLNMPTMNRQPHDGTRKTYLYDWDKKRYAVANEPDVVPRGSHPRKPRGSSIPPPKGRSLPVPQGVKRPLSAGVRTSADDAPKSKKTFGIDSDEENSSEGERSLGVKSSLEWDSELSTNSLDFEFDVKGLSESNLSSAVNSEVSEETMVKELKDKVSARRGCDSDEEGGRMDATNGEFLFPISTPDFRASDSSAGPRLQDVLDLPASASGARMNGNLLSRSAEGLSSDDEEDPSSHVFTGTRALRKSKKSLFTKGPADELQVFTKGFRQIAMDETERISREREQ